MGRLALEYTRVSTGKQAKTSLGLDAQKEAIKTFCANNGFDIVGSFQDIQSGGRDDREELQKAIATAQATGATIVVKSLCRLSRDVHFISGLMKHGVPFVVCDLGADVPSFMLHIFSAINELERKQVSDRTKAALAQSKKRGTKLGTDNPIVREAVEKRSRETLAVLAAPLKEAVVECGWGKWTAIAGWMMDKGHLTPKGKQRWYAATAKQLCEKMKALQL